MATPPAPDRLPRRDFVLIPLIALLTVLLMLGCAEWVAGRYFSEDSVGNCGIKDPLLPYRYAANCSYRNKAAEGPWVDYKFNECGYRSETSCRARAPGAIRIAMLGASTAQGFKAPYAEALAPRSAQQLSALCHRPIDIQNMGIAGFKMIDQYFRVDEALALKPDLVMLVLTPYELVDFTDPVQLANRDHPERLPKKAKAAGVNETGWIARVSAALSASKAALAAQYLLFQDRDQYVKLFLMHGDKADYLRQPLSANWESRLADLEIMLAGMAERIHGAGLPLVILYTPQRIQVALADPASRPPGIEPDALALRLKAISARHDIRFIDTFNAFRETPHPESLFYPVDGHMTGGGHALVASAMTRGLLAEQLPAFAACDRAAAPTTVPSVQH